MNHTTQKREARSARIAGSAHNRRTGKSEKQHSFRVADADDDWLAREAEINAGTAKFDAFLARNDL
jgi:hypothetical protein